ncbi:MAG TPA: 7TM-DISM domain-containing protein, partial [Turneriella sp.]|nr:7TM-DISM domain-containing protein [Turneriella sp.]
MKIFFCILFSLPLLHCTPSTPPQPTAKQGVLSLQADAASNRQAWDFKRDGTLTLDGEWELYWNQLLDPIDFNHNTNPKPTAIVRIPDVWKEQNINGVQTSNFGYATYRLRIRFPEKSFLQRQLLALRVHYELTAYRVFYNGIAVATNGNVTTDASHFQAEYRPLTVNLPTEDTDDVEIIVQVANFVHQSGGFITPIKLGLASTLIADTRLKQLTDAFLLGATLLMALYFIMLFLWRPVDKAPLWFALSCFAIITRICVTSERLIFVVIPNFPWDMLLRTTYVSTLVALIAAIFYVKNLLPLDTNRWVIRIITLVSVLLAIPILFLSPLQFTHIVFGVEVITIAALSYMVFVSFLAFVRKRENTFPLFLGFIFIVIAAMNDILYNHLQVGIGYIIPYGVLALILMHSASLLIRLATSFRRAELRKEDLEAEVALRTKRLSEAVHVAENAIQEKSVFFAMMTHEL